RRGGWLTWLPKSRRSPPWSRAGRPPTSRALAIRTRNAEASDPDPDFEASEVALLLKVCWKYRGTIPVYLQSVQAELALVDEIIRKLESLVEPTDD
ncbi:MAG: hypothetical protein ACRD1Z_09435, partial [Vicinamibacteria bacterium]